MKLLPISLTTSSSGMSSVYIFSLFYFAPSSLVPYFSLIVSLCFILTDRLYNFYFKQLPLALPVTTVSSRRWTLQTTLPHSLLKTKKKWRPRLLIKWELVRPLPLPRIVTMETEYLYKPDPTSSLTLSTQMGMRMRTLSEI